MITETQPRLTKREKRLQRQAAGGVEQQNLIPSPSFNMKRISPKTKNQSKTFAAFGANKHLFLHGSAGTGKTFISLYLALKELYNSESLQKKVFIVRSVVPTRDMGFLPGNAKEKTKVYEQPYYSICTELYERGDAYDILKQKNAVEFMSTSFIRGVTLANCIVIVDEAQNLDWMELHSIVTRAGENCRFIFCGDYKQDDLTSERYKEESGIKKFMKVISKIDDFSLVEFCSEDIVRSKLVKDYIIALEELNIQY